MSTRRVPSLSLQRPLIHSKVSSKKEVWVEGYLNARLPWKRVIGYYKEGPFKAELRESSINHV